MNYQQMQMNDSQSNTIESLDWFSSFFQNDYMENNYSEDCQQQELYQQDEPAKQECKQDSNKFMAQQQNDIYVIQEDSQENALNLASKNTLSTFHTPKNKGVSSHLSQNILNQQQIQPNYLNFQNDRSISDYDQIEQNDLKQISNDIIEQTEDKNLDLKNLECQNNDSNLKKLVNIQQHNNFDTDGSLISSRSTENNVQKVEVQEIQISQNDQNQFKENLVNSLKSQRCDFQNDVRQQLIEKASISNIKNGKMNILEEKEKEKVQQQQNEQSGLRGKNKKDLILDFIDNLSLNNFSNNQQRQSISTTINQNSQKDNNLHSKLKMEHEIQKQYFEITQQSSSIPQIKQLVNETQKNQEKVEINQQLQFQNKSNDFQSTLMNNNPQISLFPAKSQNNSTFSKNKLSEYFDSMKFDFKSQIKSKANIKEDLKNLKQQNEQPSIQRTEDVCLGKQITISHNNDQESFHKIRRQPIWNQEINDTINELYLIKNVNQIENKINPDLHQNQDSQRKEELINSQIKQQNFNISIQEPSKIIKVSSCNQINQSNRINQGNIDTTKTSQMKGFSIQFPSFDFQLLKTPREKRKPTESENNITSVSSYVNDKNQLFNNVNDSDFKKSQSNFKSGSQKFNQLQQQNSIYLTNTINQNGYISEKSVSQNQLMFEPKSMMLFQNTVNTLNKLNQNKLKHYQEDFNSLIDKLDSMISKTQIFNSVSYYNICIHQQIVKSSEQKWETQYLYEQQKNINEDIQDIFQVVKKLL